MSMDYDPAVAHGTGPHPNGMLALEARTTIRQAEVLDSLCQGYGYADTARHLGCTTETVYAIYMSALAELASQRPRYTERMRDRQAARLERIWMTLEPALTADNLEAIDRALKIHAAVATLHGLNVKQPAEATQAATDSATLSDADLLARIRQRIARTDATDANSIIDVEPTPQDGTE